MDFILIILSFILVSVIFYLIHDYFGPKTILLRSGNLFGLSCRIANDLIVHEFDKDDNLWASRGMIIYRLGKGDNKFIKVTHVPTSFSLFWLNNFRIVRRLTVNPECMEISVAGDGRICALSAGYLWHQSSDRGKFIKTLKLSHYGIRVGRGIFNGLLKANDDLLFFGEYFRNKEKTHVRIYKSIDFGLNWEIAHEFLPGSIYHIHSLQRDPYTKKLWICTGDNSNESMIGWSDDDYKNITPIGSGSLIWAACQLIFTEDAVYWGTDADSEDVSGIYRWDKKNMQLTCLLKTCDAIFYGTRLKSGTTAMSTDREGLSIEKDDRTRLYLLDQFDNITIIKCGTWNHKKSGFRFRFAKLRFQRNQDKNILIISCLNQKEITDGDLIIITDETINYQLTVEKSQLAFKDESASYDSYKDLDFSDK